MASKHFLNSHTQNASTYVNKKGINELFEAIMTALVMQKPDDHLTFIRDCLDKAQQNPHRIRWELFVPNSSTTRSSLPVRSMSNRSRTKVLPPVHSSSSMNKRQTSTSIKPSALPRIEDRKKQTIDVPMIFILNSTGSTKICSRLIERYQQLLYISINDVANIDDDHRQDLSNVSHRYDAVLKAIEQSRSEARAYLIAGDFEEKNFVNNWKEKLGHVDSVIILTDHPQENSDPKVHNIHVDATDDFDDILTEVIRITDEVLPHDIIVEESLLTKVENAKLFKLPVIFCIDNHRHSTKENDSSKINEQNQGIDDEFGLIDGETKEEINNSFINTLCERISAQFSFQHLHYVETNNSKADYRLLKNCITESMGNASGFIIDHFPRSIEDLKKFRSQIAPCSALIYIGEHQTDSENGELNQIVKHFENEKKAIFVDCRMEVDEIYEDLRNELLSLIQ